MSAVISAAVMILADGGDSPSDVDSTTGHGPEWGEAAPVGLLVIVVMCIAVYFLVKSFNRNLKKIPASFEPPVAVSVGATSHVSEATGDQPDSPGAAGPGSNADPGPPNPAQ